MNGSAGGVAGASGAACAPFATPWGRGIVVVSAGRLAEVRLPWPGGAAAPGDVAYVTSDEARGAGHAETAPCDVRSAPLASAGDGPWAEADREAAARWAEELEAYFAGRVSTWSVDEVGVDDWDVTPFRRAVYRALLAVPPGATVSYGELARMAGAPRAARAVGSAMAANPAPIVVPCHRVVRADGSPGRYGECDAWKVELLRHEGAL